MRDGSKRPGKEKREQSRAVYFRRSPFLVSYWNSHQLIFHNYLTGKAASASPQTAVVLDFFGKWRAESAMLRRWPEYSARSLRTSIHQLAQQTFLEVSSKKHPKESKAVLALRKWHAWNPAAGFFHLSTKDSYSQEITSEEIQYIEGLMESTAARSAMRQGPSGKMIALSSGPHASEFSQVLKERRTWRKFSTGKVKLETLATLLDLSFGVQQWEQVAKIGKLAQKTSPSGGSLHPLEAYVMVRKVEAIAPGIYHYDAAGKGLRQVRRGANAQQIQNYLAGQWWFRDAAIVVFLTAVFRRTQWKYDYPRAYRAIQIEAGHLAQTFCLTATWLGLAPFCTIALADTEVEKALKVDGISESVIYAMGAGMKFEVRHARSARGMPHPKKLFKATW